MSALRLAGKSDTEWDIIEGRSDRVVGRVVWENGAFFLTDVDGGTELGAFYRLEHTVSAAEALLVGSPFEPPSAA
ncbi:hypothetical protein [Curtobacterium sp. BRB10]|uniref:hypothetical protein n=1 Tax=Curtobacterium sp. BRB10 TaxID=2962579 RepID=UPI002881F181|nr:hypothetical protein [Curtobacterium sp. BRB10]MDT0235244.1 hypothetical protein [Curtobacterium sp. BRB10]